MSLVMPNQSGQRVLIQDIGRFERTSKVLFKEHVEYISYPGASVLVRLDELRSLRDGWLDGKGYAPHTECLQWLAKVFRENYQDNLPLPYVYPTAEGGVQLEWSGGTWESSLEINLKSHTGEWHALQLKNNKEEIRTLDLGNTKDWQWLTYKIAEQAVHP